MNPAGDSAVETFGPYEVYERLGIGGMATVHRAKKRGPAGFEQTIALKRMLAHLAEDPTFVESFVREAKVASLLVHPNIAQVYDFGRIRGIYYIAMELVAGFDVRKLLRYASKHNEPIPLPVILTILGELCDALDHAHSFVADDGTPLGIVHRDVSPSNMIVAHTGHLKVIDFGIAKAQARQLHTESGKVKGKLGYMSPEAALGLSSGPVSDMFSTGVVAWELVTASPLFTTRTDMETMQRIREATITPPSYHNPQCPPELDQLILSALEREPTRRLSSAASFRAGLDDIASRAGIQLGARAVVEWISRFAQPEDGWVRTSHPSRERPPTGRSSPPASPAVDPTSVIRGSARRAHTPSRPPQLRRSAEHVALATEIWGEDAQRPASDPGPDFSVPNVRAATPMPGLPTTRVLGPDEHARISAQTVVPPMRGSSRAEANTVPPPMRAHGKSVPPPMPVPTTDSIVSLSAGHDARVANLPLRPNRPSTPPRPSNIVPEHASAPHAPSGPYVAPLLVPSSEYLPPPPLARRSKAPVIVLAALAAVAGVLIAILMMRSSSSPSEVVIAPPPPTPTPATDPAVGSGSSDVETALPDAAVEPVKPIAEDIELQPEPGSAAVTPVKPTQRPPRPIKPAPRVEPKPERPEPKPEAKPEPKPEPRPEPRPEPKPDPKPEPAIAKPEPAKPARTPVVGATAVTKLSGEIPALRAETDGTIVVKVCIDESGRVTGVSSAKADGDLLGQLQRGLASWRYKPYVRDGKPSAVCFPLSLRLLKR